MRNQMLVEVQDEETIIEDRFNIKDCSPPSLAYRESNRPKIEIGVQLEIPGG